MGHVVGNATLAGDGSGFQGVVNDMWVGTQTEFGSRGGCICLSRVWGRVVNEQGMSLHVMGCSSRMIGWGGIKARGRLNNFGGYIDTEACLNGMGVEDVKRGGRG
eukprot:754994-Hanusia_phi.AAC.11